MKIFKFKKTKARQRLKVMYVVLTDKASYLVYNTQTSPDDFVNIEIERVDKNGKKLILKEELIEDSWASFVGNSFHHLVLDSICHLKTFIKNNNEEILNELRDKGL